MTRGFIALALAAAPLLPTAARAQSVVAGQDFNQLNASFTSTVDEITNDQALTNAGSFNAGGPGLDFVTRWFATRPNTPVGPRVPAASPGGETGNDFIGVNAATVSGLPATSPTGASVAGSGDHNYEFNDGDGRLDLVFETVDLAGRSGRSLRFYYWLSSASSFEAGDALSATLSDGTQSSTLLDLQSAALNTNRGSWIQVSVDLETLIGTLGFAPALTLTISVDVNANDETIIVDDVAFLDNSAVGPIPASIPAIQGATDTSPLAGSAVSTSGVVTADFQASTQLSGFFLQDPGGDGNPATSDGIFVAAPIGLGDVDVGDVVTVQGTVSESGGLTKLVASEISFGASGSIAPTPVVLPETINGELERYEGMLISISSTLTVAQTFFVGRYGQLTLAAPNARGVPERLFQPTQLFDPGTPAALSLADENQRRLLVLDDGQDVQPLGDNPNPVPYLGAPPPAVRRAGDRVSNLVGVLDFGRINAATTPALDYRLHPTQPPTFAPQNPRTGAPSFSGLSVVGMNVLNYFTTLGSRGARNASELVRQRDKIVQSIEAIGADIYGLTEIENNTAAIQDLVSGLNAASSAGKYAFINTGVIGTDEIKVAFIYTSGTVTPVGSHAVLTDSVDPRAITTRNRPAVAQTFRSLETDETVTVAVNHFKSKGSACNTVAPGTNEIVDPDVGDGQGNCNLSRESMALALADWLAGAPTGNADPDILIIGDLNAYANEDPIKALEAEGYQNVVKQRLGGAAYSYVFDGQSGYLDHALASPSLAAKVAAVAEWHNNADEPKVIDYDTEFNPPGYYTADPYRASDHDALIVKLGPAPSVPALGGRSSWAGLLALGLLLAAPLALRRPRAPRADSAG